VRFDGVKHILRSHGNTLHRQHTVHVNRNLVLLTFSESIFILTAGPLQNIFSLFKKHFIPMLFSFFSHSGPVTIFFILFLFFLQETSPFPENFITNLLLNVEYERFKTSPRLCYDNMYVGRSCNVTFLRSKSKSNIYCGLACKPIVVGTSLYEGWSCDKHRYSNEN
jgi:hypothetical protein